jgi:hypothetical protein
MFKMGDRCSKCTVEVRKMCLMLEMGGRGGKQVINVENGW